MTKRHTGDTFEVHIGSVSGPVHTGKGDIIVESWDARGVTAADLEALRALFAGLRERVAAEALPELADEAQAQVDTLEQVTTAKEPDLSTIERVRDWCRASTLRRRQRDLTAGQSHPGQSGRGGRRPGGR